MEIKKIGSICKGQDGAIWGDYLFRFNVDGSCRVYDLRSKPGPFGQLPEVGSFFLGEDGTVIPHSNSVMFGSEFYCPEDEFPLLYSNIYNNCAQAEDTMRSYTCVYRITREDGCFHARLVQLISLSFVDDTSLWNAPEDKRPYGNFVIDRSKGLYHAFTMQDSRDLTRFFTFRLPKLSDGTPDEKTGIPRVLLHPEDILDRFDCPYQYFLQGACAHNGKIYSLEGFSYGHEGAPPALRIFSTQTKQQELLVLFSNYGMEIEPEFIDFWGNMCLYSDNPGNLYTLDFSPEEL